MCDNGSFITNLATSEGRSACLIEQQPSREPQLSTTAQKHTNETECLSGVTKSLINGNNNILGISDAHEHPLGNISSHNTCTQQDLRRLSLCTLSGAPKPGLSLHSKTT